MLIETLHTLMISGFLAVWLLVGYVTMREMSRQRKSSSPAEHRFDATHSAALPPTRSRARHADRRPAATASRD